MSSLPRRVQIKDINDRYLGAIKREEVTYFQFSSGDHSGSFFIHEVVNAPDGFYWVKNEYYQKYWRRSDDDWITAGYDPIPQNMLFEIRRGCVDNAEADYFTIKNLGNQKLCRSNPEGALVDFLKADVLELSPSIPDEAKFWLEDFGPVNDHAGTSNAQT